ncbi:MAG: inorganic diphosphatase [Brumimicrobium sp.]
MSTFDAFIEIPSKSRVKYEYDFKYKKIRFDRLLYSSLQYPTEYGFIPNTLAEDGDPLDVLVLTAEPLIPGVLIELKAIGVMYMVDGGDNDDKIVCVPVDDPQFNNFEDINDVNDHLKKEIEEFFKTYKNLEGKRVETKGFADRRTAEQMVEKCKVRYNNLPADKKWECEL